MTTNDITLDDAKLAEIEAAAREADPESLWGLHDGDDGICILGYDGLGDPWSVGSVSWRPDAAHIVATQPRVALALVAEIRRLRAEVAALRGEGVK